MVSRAQAARSEASPGGDDAPPHDPRAVDEAALLRLAEEVAAAAARLVHAGRPARLEVAEKASASDVVTQMDTAAERLVRDLLAAARPQDAVLGEEGGAGPAAAAGGLTWVVDPIDGTYNYLHDQESYAVSLAVVLGDPTTPGAWEPVAGVVHAPALGRVYGARRGAGAWRRSTLEPDAPAEPIAVLGDRDQERWLVATGFSTLAARRRVQGAVVADLVPDIADLRRSGSAALDLCRVASGQVDGYYEQGLNVWDIAAGVLIAREAGAVVEGPDGAAPDGRVLVAGRPAVVAALSPRVRALWAD